MTGILPSRTSGRKHSGTSMIELPFSLWILFIVLAFPLISVATLGMRYACLKLAADEAARAAANATQFSENVPADPGPPAVPEELSAVNAANQVAQKVTTSFGGVSLQQTDVTILITKTTDDPPLTKRKAANTKLDSGELDTAQNLYQVEVALKAKLDPLVTIPHVIERFDTFVASRQVCEVPTGLTK